MADVMFAETVAEEADAIGLEGVDEVVEPRRFGDGGTPEYGEAPAKRGAEGAVIGGVDWCEGGHNVSRDEPSLRPDERGGGGLGRIAFW